jgi:hypothetical protein
MDIYKHLDSFEDKAVQRGDFGRALRYGLIRSLLVTDRMSVTDAVDLMIEVHYRDLRDSNGNLLS